MATSENYKLVYDIQTKGVSDLEAIKKAIADIEAGGLRSIIAFAKMEDGVIKTGAALGGVALAAVLAGKAIFNLAAETGRLAEQQLNVAERTGLSVKEVGLFSKLAENAGINASAFTGAMRGLSKALSENSDEGKKAKQSLQQFGVTLTDQFGAALPTRDLYIKLAQAIGGIESPTQRADLALKVLGRSGLELLPLLRTNVAAAVSELEKLGVGFTEEGAQKAAEFDNKVDLLNTRLAVLKQRLGEVAVGIAGMFIAKGGTVVNPTLNAPKAGMLALDPSTLVGSFFTGKEMPLQSLPGLTQSTAMTDAQRSALLTQTGQGVMERILDAGDGDLRAGLAAQIQHAQKRLQEAMAITDIAAVRTINSHILYLQKSLAGIFQTPESFGQPDFSGGPLIGRLNRAPTLGGLVTINPEATNAYGDPRIRVNPNTFTDASGNLVVNSGLAGGPTRTDFRAGFDVMGAGRENDDARIQFAARVQQAELDFIIRKRELLTGPGGELQAARDIAAIRIASARDDLEAQQALMSVELTRLALVKARQDAVRGVGEQFTASLFGGVSGISGFFKNQGINLVSKVGGNLAANLLGSTSFQIPGVKSADGSPSFLGKLLQGTPFGIDPLKGATDANTIATVENTRALYAAITGGAGGGGISPDILSNVAGGGDGSFWRRIQWNKPSGGGGGGGLSPEVLANIGGGGDGSFTSSGFKWPSFLSNGASAIGKLGLSAASSYLIARGAANPRTTGGDLSTIGGGAAAGFAYGGPLGAGIGAAAGSTIAGYRYGPESVRGAGLMGDPIGAGVFAAGGGPYASLAANFAIGGIPGLGGLRALFGRGGLSPKDRAQQIQDEVNAAQFTGSTPNDYVFSTGGGSVDFDFRGSARSTNPVQVIVNAMDAQSFLDRSSEIADAVRLAMQRGHRINQTTRETAIGQ